MIKYLFIMFTSSDIHIDACSLQERSILLRKWFDLINQHKEDLAKLITAECVGILTQYIQDTTSNVSVYKDSDMTIGYNSIVCTGEAHEGVYR